MVSTRQQLRIWRVADSRRHAKSYPTPLLFRYIGTDFRVVSFFSLCSCLIHTYFLFIFIRPRHDINDVDELLKKALIVSSLGIFIYFSKSKVFHVFCSLLLKSSFFKHDDETMFWLIQIFIVIIVYIINFSFSIYC